MRGGKKCNTSAFEYSLWVLLDKYRVQNSDWKIMAVHSSEVLNTSVTETWLRSHNLAPEVLNTISLWCGTGGLWNYSNLHLNVPVSLQLCDTHQHPATSSFTSRTTAKWPKPTRFLIRTHPLEEFLMLKGEWSCFHIIWKNKKRILTKQASVQLAWIT